MKNLKRIIIFLMIAAFCFICSGLSAFATDELDPNAGQGDVVNDVPNEDSGPAVDPEPQNGDSGNNDSPAVNSDAEALADDNNYNQQAPQDNNNYYDNNNNYYENSVENNNDYYYYDEDSMASQLSGDDRKAGSVSDKTNLYDTPDVNDSELKSNEWNEIVLSEKDAAAGADDFSSIKDNKSKNDNGGWILYTGIILIVLSICGIIYFIVATYKSKKLSKLPPDRRPAQRAPGRNIESGYNRTAERPSQRSGRTGSYQRERHRYNDGYDNYSKKSSKADTQEIYIPRRYAKK